MRGELALEPSVRLLRFKWVGAVAIETLIEALALATRRQRQF
jgi:hypothetical protein